MIHVYAVHWHIADLMSWLRQGILEILQPMPYGGAFAKAHPGWIAGCDKFRTKPQVHAWDPALGYETLGFAMAYHESLHARHGVSWEVVPWKDILLKSRD